MKLKNSHFDETQKLKLRWKSNTQIVIRLKHQIAMKLKNANCDKAKKIFNGEETPNLKL